MLKKTLVVLLLLVTPFAQARAGLVCAMMTGQILEQCCCPGHAGTAAARHDVSHGACCDVVIEVGDKDLAGISADLPVMKRVGHDAPDHFAVTAPAIVMATVVAVPRTAHAIVPILPASPLYLRTARLRL
jgi:hypothetical protein